MPSLAEIQQNLKAPKGQFNKFGGYKYRSCEDILEAVKPLLGDAIITISDEILMVGERHYVKAIATFKNKDAEISVTAYAREPDQKKGMDASQITGAASSYARKYALNGLLLIDDNKDADTDQYTQQLNQPQGQKYTQKVKSSYRNVDNSNQKVTAAMRSIISYLTDNFTDQAMIQKTCGALGIKQLQDLNNVDLDRKLEMLDYLKTAKTEMEKLRAEKVIDKLREQDKK